MASPNLPIGGPPTSPGFPAAPADREIHLLDRLSVLHKYRRPALGVFVVVVAWFMVDSYSMTPMYRSVARIEIESDNAGSGHPAISRRTSAMKIQRSTSIPSIEF